MKDETDSIEQTEIFGHRFRDYSDLIADLVSVEREGAIYSHFYDESSQTFLYYRIRLRPREVYQFIESHLARQEYLDARAEGADFEAALRAISRSEIRERVLSYDDTEKLPDGTSIDHRGCPASFYPPDLEELLSGNRRDRYELLPEISTTDRAALAISIIDSFPVIRRFLSRRKHGRPPILLENEYDTQDLLFCLLRASFHDASQEEWTPAHAGSAKRVDIVIPSARTFVEVKHIRDREHARRIGNDLKIDIESYHAHPQCKNLIAFVHDPAQHIVDPTPLMRDLSGLRRKGASEFEVHVLVR